MKIVARVMIGFYLRLSWAFLTAARVVRKAAEWAEQRSTFWVGVWLE